MPRGTLWGLRMGALEPGDLSLVREFQFSYFYFLRLARRVGGLQGLYQDSTGEGFGNGVGVFAGLGFGLHGAWTSQGLSKRLLLIEQRRARAE